MLGTFTRSALAAIVLAFAASFAASTPAFAHGGGVIRLASNQVSVAGTLGVTGEKLDKNSSVKLELRGILDNYPIGDVKTDAAGAFSTSITLPPHAPAGAYTLVAIGADGDVAARASLTVGGAGGGSAAGAAGAAGTMAGMPGMEATAEMMVLQHRTSVAEWVVIWALIIASAAAGAMLLRRSASARHA